MLASVLLCGVAALVIRHQPTSASVSTTRRALHAASCVPGTTRRALRVAASATWPADELVDVCVVGGGPAGLAAATSLASSGLSVGLVERRPTPSEFEIKRAYLYLLDRRGQTWTDAHNLTDAVRARGVSNDGYTITKVWPTASKGAITSKPPLVSDATAKAVWIPRSTLLDVFASAAAAAGVDLQYGTAVESLERGEGADERVAVRLANGRVMRPSLLVAADGLDSMVRSALKRWSADDDEAAAFEPVLLPSPSSGLRYKMLLVPPSFELRNLSVPAGSSHGSKIVTSAGSAYSIPSVLTRPQVRLRLGLLPSRAYT